MDKIAKANGGRRKEKAIGIDLGLRNLIVMSNGVSIGHHPSLPRLKYNLRVFGHKLEGQETGSKRWYETLRIINKTKAELERCQQDYANKLAHMLCKHYKTICIEAPISGGTIKQEVENDIYIANWDMVRATIKKKCLETGTAYVEVAPFYTTQTCSKCGERQKLALGDRTYNCPKCGLSLDRDINAAINLKRKGLEKLKRQQKAREKLGFPPF